MVQCFGFLWLNVDHFPFITSLSHFVMIVLKNADFLTQNVLNQTHLIVLSLNLMIST